MKQDFKISLEYVMSTYSKAKRKQLKNKKVQRHKYPLAIEKSYKKWISEFIAQWVFLVKENILKNLNNWIKENKRGDSIKFDEWQDNLENAISELENLNSDYFLNPENREWLIGILIVFFNNTNDFNEKQWIETVMSKLTLEPPLVNPTVMSGLEKQFVNDNINLIKGITEEYRKKIQITVSNGLSQGLSYKDIANEIAKISNQFTGYRSELIARDQISKLDGELQRIRQQDIGVEYYIWNTMIDERVRPTHRALENKYCDWRDNTIYSDDLKSWESRNSNMFIGIPGQDFQCRCYGEPVFDDNFYNIL